MAFSPASRTVKKPGPIQSVDVDSDFDWRNIFLAVSKSPTRQSQRYGDGA
jgi:hypothetical protein